MNQEEVWDKISESWKEFRKELTSEAEHFLKGKKGNILDLGCGSGRNFVKIKGTIYGVDFSEEMLKHAKKEADRLKLKVILKKAEVCKLPFKDEFFDSAIFIATLHCIDSKEKRKKALKELFRVLKFGGDVLITVWSRKNQRIKNKPKECFIPWTFKGKKYQRYTYVYDKEELESLLKEVGFKIKKIWENDNISALAIK